MDEEKAHPEEDGSRQVRRHGWTDWTMHGVLDECPGSRTVALKERTYVVGAIRCPHAGCAPRTILSISSFLGTGLGTKSALGVQSRTTSPKGTTRHSFTQTNWSEHASHCSPAATESGSSFSFDGLSTSVSAEESKSGRQFSSSFFCFAHSLPQ